MKCWGNSEIFLCVKRFCYYKCFFELCIWLPQFTVFSTTNKYYLGFFIDFFYLHVSLICCNSRKRLFWKYSHLLKKHFSCVFSVTYRIEMINPTGLTSLLTQYWQYYLSSSSFGRRLAINSIVVRFLKYICQSPCVFFFNVFRFIKQSKFYFHKKNYFASFIIDWLDKYQKRTFFIGFFEFKITLMDCLYVLVMSRTCFRVNPRSIVTWMSRNSMLETDAKSKI